MISSVLALTLAAAAPGPSPETIAPARKAYLACLGAFMKKGVADKMAVDAFDAAIAPACAAQEQAFRTAVIAVDTGAGVKRAAAEENAGLEVEDMLANMKETFKDAMTPAKPKS